MDIYSWLSWLLNLIGVLHLGIVAYVWRYRDVPGGTPYMLAMAAGGAWAFSFGLLLGNPDLEFALRLNQLRLAVLSFMGPALFLMLLEYSRQETVRDKRLLSLLLAIPAVTVVLAATMPWHTLLRHDFRRVVVNGIPGVASQDGAWFMVHMHYTNLLTIAGVGLGLASMRGRGLLYRRQVALLSAAPLLPLALNLAFMSGVWPAPTLNLAPFSLLISGYLMAVPLFRHRMFDLRPQAVEAAVQQLHDAFVLADARGRVVDLNPAAGLLLGLPPGEVLGKTLTALFSGWPEGQAMAQRSEADFEAETAGPPGALQECNFYDVRCSGVKSGAGVLVGRVLQFRDITDRRRLEESLVQSLAHERELHQLKTTFVALVSHEFRAPLATLQGAADLLSSHFDSASTAVRQRSLEAIRNQISRLTALLDQATALNRLEEGRVPFSPRPADAALLLQS